MNRINLLLEKLRRQTCSPEELMELKRILSPDQREILHQYLNEDLQSQSDQLEEDLSKRTWSRIEKEVGRSQWLNTDTHKRIGKRRILVSAVAAVFVLLVVSYQLVLITPETEMLSYENLLPEAQQIILPDSSIAWLNQNSSIQFPEQFSDENRKVILKGQGFFEVRRDEERPFEVRSGSVITTALGTSFDISAYHPEEEIIVALFTGKIRIDQPVTQEQWIVNPGQEMTFRLGREPSLTTFSIESKSIWKNGEFRFQEKSLVEVTRILEENFGEVSIVIENTELLKESVSGTFRKADGLEDILELICFNKNCQVSNPRENIYKIK